MALAAGQVARTSCRLGRLRLDAGRLNALLGPPIAPYAPTPASGSVASPFTLAWLSDGATTYDVYVGTSPAPPLVASNHSATSYTLPPLTAGLTYYWRVVARNVFGTSSGPVWAFTAVAPSVGASPSPANGAMGVSSAPLLQWTGTGGFNVYFGPAGVTPLPLVASTLATSLAVGPLANDTVYAWRIEASNNAGVAIGPTWTFRTAALAAPANPNPPHNARKVPAAAIALSWSASPGAYAYDVYFGVAGGGPLTLWASGLLTPTVTTGVLSRNTRYLWRVVARSVGGDTSGPVWAFTTASDTEFFITIDGVVPHMRLAGVSVTDVLNDAPNTATFRVDTDPPHVGQEVKIGLGSLAPGNLIFAGTIDTVEDAYEGYPAHRVWTVQCIDYARRLNRYKVRRRYGQASASTIAIDLVATYGRGFTTAGVAPNLPIVTGGIDFTEEDLGTCLKRLAQRVGGYFYVDYARDVHLFLTELTDPPDPITPGRRNLLDDPPIARTVDLTQIRTRVYVEGGGAAARNSVAVGATTIPVTDGSWYPGTGGLVVSGPQRIRYTAKGQTGGPAAPTAAAQLLAGSLLNGPYSYKVAIVTEGVDGPLSPASSAVPLPSVANPTGSLTVTDGASGYLAAPAGGSTIGGPTTGGGLTGGVSYQWAWTFVTAGGETELGASGSGSPQYLVTPAYSGLPVSAVAGGTLVVGQQYQYYLTYGTATGETPYVAVGSGTAVTGGQSLRVSSIVRSTDPAWTRTFLYRATAGANAPARARRVASLGTFGGSTTEWIDTGVADGAESLPMVNTALKATFTVSVPTGPAGVTSRKLYRKGGTSEFRLVTTVAGNATAPAVTDDRPDTSLGAPAPLGNTTGAGTLGVGTYQWRMTFVTATGETDAGPVASRAITRGGATLTTLPTTADPRVTGRRLYRSSAGGTDAKFEADVSLGITTYESTKGDNALGAPFQAGNRNTASGQIQITNIPTGPVGSTRRLYRTTAGGGSYQALTLIDDHTTTTYLDNIPDGNLGGVAAGDVVTELTGIPASGPGSILYPIRISDDVNLVAECNDVPAQQALQALEGGDSDGIYEHTLQDRRLSAAEATATGNADLALFARPIVVVRYATRDPRTRSGKTISINLPSLGLSGAFMIQRVTIDQIGFSDLIFPRYTVEASSTRYSFEDLLRQVLIQP